MRPTSDACSKGWTSSTTSCIRWAPVISARVTGRPPTRWRAKLPVPAPSRSCISAGSATTPLTCRRISAAVPRRRACSPPGRARVLAAGDAPVTSLRAAVVVGHGSAGFETIVALVDRLPLMIAPKWVSMPTQPIALADVVGYLVGVARHDGAIGETFDIGGPDVLTYRDMIERVARLRGRRTRIIEGPVLSPRLSPYWLHLVTPVRASVSRPLVEGLRNPTVARDERIRELLPRDLIPFDQAAQEALRAQNPESVP